MNTPFDPMEIQRILGIDHLPDTVRETIENELFTKDITEALIAGSQLERILTILIQSVTNRVMPGNLALMIVTYTLFYKYREQLTSQEVHDHYIEFSKMIADLMQTLLDEAKAKGAIK